MDTLHKIIVLSNPRKFCNLCRNSDTEQFYFTSNKDKEGNTYINVKCKCGGRSKLGLYKSGGYFWHDYEKYDRKVTTADKASSDLLKEEIDDADVPF